MKVGVDLSGIEALRKDLRRLSTRDLKRAVFGALDDVALDANERLARRFEQDIEGGPSRFTEIHPGDKKSSVLNTRARREGGSVASSLVVQRKQARYLAFGLGEDDVREPGEAGFSTKTNINPLKTAGTGVFQMKRDRHGNVSRSQVRKAFAAVKATEAADRKRLAKRGQEADAAALKAERLRRARKRRKDQDTYASRFSLPIGAKTDKKVAQAEKRLTRPTDGLFIVERKKLGGLTPGIWQRARLDRFGKPKLIAAFSKRSRYPHAHLVDGWNASVRGAAEGIAEAVRRRLDGSNG